MMSQGRAALEEELMSSCSSEERAEEDRRGFLGCKANDFLRAPGFALSRGSFSEYLIPVIVSPSSLWTCAQEVPCCNPRSGTLVSKFAARMRLRLRTCVSVTSPETVHTSLLELAQMSRAHQSENGMVSCEVTRCRFQGPIAAFPRRDLGEKADACSIQRASPNSRVAKDCIEQEAGSRLERHEAVQRRLRLRLLSLCMGVCDFGRRERSRGSFKVAKK